MPDFRTMRDERPRRPSAALLETIYQMQRRQEWMREYLLKITLRQIIHPQVSEQNWREAMDWVLSDEVHPFSFRVCCEAMMCDFEDVRATTLKIAAKELFK